MISLLGEDQSDVYLGPMGPFVTGVSTNGQGGSIALSAVTTWWGFSRYPDVFIPPRRGVVIIMEWLLLPSFLLLCFIRPVGRLLAMRSTIVLRCFLIIPLGVVWVGEVVIVRLTRDARGETAWRLLDHCGLVFNPLLSGILVARNLPIVASWGWAR